MKKAILIMLLTTLIFSAGAYAASKPLCLVTNFETTGGAAKSNSVNVAKMFMTGITYVGEYKSLSYDKQTKIMESISKKAGAKVTKAEAIEMAKKVNATVVVTGEVAKSGKKYTLTVNFIDVETGKIIKTESKTRSYQSQISKSIDDILGLT